MTPRAHDEGAGRRVTCWDATRSSPCSRLPLRPPYGTDIIVETITGAYAPGGGSAARGCHCCETVAKWICERYHLAVDSSGPIRNQGAPHGLPTGLHPPACSRYRCEARSRERLPVVGPSGL